MAYYNNEYSPRQNNNRNSFGSRESVDKSVNPAPVKIESFYKGSDIDPDLFDKKALEIAKSFVGKDKFGNDVGVTSTQLRKIFDEVKRFEQLLQVGENQFAKQLPYIKMIKSKVAYSVARAVKNKSSSKCVYDNLSYFIKSSIDLIKTETDYHVFVSLFEAAYGFYYELAPKDCK